MFSSVDGWLVAWGGVLWTDSWTVSYSSIIKWMLLLRSYGFWHQFCLFLSTKSVFSSVHPVLPCVELRLPSESTLIFCFSSQSVAAQPPSRIYTFCTPSLHTFIWMLTAAKEKGQQYSGVLHYWGRILLLMRLILRSQRGLLSLRTSTTRIQSLEWDWMAERVPVMKGRGCGTGCV